MNMPPDLPTRSANPLRRILRSPGQNGLSGGEFMLVIAVILAALGGGAMIVQGGSGSGGGTAAAASAVTERTDAPADATAAAVTPEQSDAPRQTTKSRLRALRHPLIGVSRQKLISRLGPPARRSTEGGSAMEFLEYEIENQEYQVVVLRGRVVELNRFR